jgi:[acyl-carrier-protein] S-malonyltransferase
MESMEAGKLAIVFPGHGAHEPNMLDGLIPNKKFDDYYACIVDAIGFAPLEAMQRDPSLVNSHSLSTLLTMLASALSYLKFVDVQGKLPDYLAGYSIGEFTALHAAGCFDFAHLVSLIKVRSSIIDETLQSTPGSMLGIVGTGLAAVETVVNELTSEGHKIYISNYNCAGQYSLSGSHEGIKEALVRLAVLKPKRLLELPVAGPWHCPLLSEAQLKIADHLRNCDWKEPQIPVIDNVTGELLPNDVAGIKEQVIKQVTAPVKWDTGIKTLVKLGCNRFVEVGYGNVLTKFGFFIDRNADFSHYYGDDRVETASV